MGKLTQKNILNAEITWSRWDINKLMGGKSNLQT